MLKSVKDVIEKSMNDYKVTNRAKWITSHTGQAILGVSMLYWTMEADEVMRKNGLEGLR